MIIIPKRGPKNEPKVSINDKIPIWLKKVSQKIPIKNPNKVIIIAELFKLSFVGKKFNNEFCAGI